MYTERKSSVPFPSSRPSRLLSRERHSFITLCLSRGSLCVYRHECRLPFKQPSFGRQGRGGLVSDGAFLEAVLCSLQTGSQAQQFQLWHSVLKIEIPVCQDRDWRILLMHFCSGQKEGEEKEEKKEKRKEKEIQWKLVREVIGWIAIHSQRGGGALLRSLEGLSWCIFI